jgi:hypothetical protein
VDAVVAKFNVAVAVALAAGVIGVLGVKEHVGALGTTGATEQASVTGELNPSTEVTVTVAVAETPGLPEAGDRAPVASVKLASEYLATKASKLPPPKLVW